MRRWSIWIILLLCSGLWGLQAVEAQPTRKVFRVGYLRAGSSPLSAPLHVAFVQGLKDLGYIQGQNVIIEDRKANGQADRLPDLAAELERLPVDVIVANGPEAVLRAAQLGDAHDTDYKVIQ